MVGRSISSTAFAETVAAVRFRGVCFEGVSSLMVQPHPTQPRAPAATRKTTGLQGKRYGGGSDRYDAVFDGVLSQLGRGPQAEHFHDGVLVEVLGLGTTAE